MSTRTYYHARKCAIDLSSLPQWLYDEVISLHGQIKPPPAPPIFQCVGNGEPMYLFRNNSGRYFARHYPGGNADGHTHPIYRGMSDQHRRQAEYSQLAAARHGFDARLEVSTGGGTRLDVAITGTVNAGLEIQRSELSRVAAQARATKSHNAGWPTAWITDQERDPKWADYVPTARLIDRGGWSERMPSPNTAKVIISDYTRERDRSKPQGWAYRRTPKYVLLDELAYLMPAGEIIPVRSGRYATLAFASCRDLIDSCTYPGASIWRPTAATPRQKEAAQRFSSQCKHPSKADRCPVCQLPINPAFPISTHYDCARRGQ